MIAAKKHSFSKSRSMTKSTTMSSEEDGGGGDETKQGGAVATSVETSSNQGQQQHSISSSSPLPLDCSPGAELRLLMLPASSTSSSPSSSSSTSAPHFSRTRLTQWHSNEEIYSILTQCSHYLTTKSSPSSGEWLLLGDDLASPNGQRRLPQNGSVFLFDRRRCKNFKKDGFSWKRRKTGGANSVREDRMYLKINGVDKIYGCYSHSSIVSTFHRRCYWLLDKPDLVLVHYLHTPNTETGECVINLSGASNETDN